MLSRVAGRQPYTQDSDCRSRRSAGGMDQDDAHMPDRLPARCLAGPALCWTWFRPLTSPVPYARLGTAGGLTAFASEWFAVPAPHAPVFSRIMVAWTQPSHDLAGRSQHQVSWEDLRRPHYWPAAR